PPDRPPPAGGGRSGGGVRREAPLPGQRRTVHGAPPPGGPQLRGSAGPGPLGEQQMGERGRMADLRRR
ncbi:DeoR family transcriptional regulator, partial [Streptomyces albidoflavus]